MITDEDDLARSLRTVESPLALRLNADDVLSTVHRTHRRRQIRMGTLTTVSVAAVAAATLWATGSTAGPIAVLPAAPWTQACEGIISGPDGTRINLDQVSSTELPLSGSATGTTAVIALDPCRGEAAQVTYVTRGADGELSTIGKSVEVDAETLQVLREGRSVRPNTARTPAGEVLFGVVATEATHVRVLTAVGTDDVQRQTLPDTKLDAYVSPEFSDPGMETVGMSWRNGDGENVVWLQVLDTADFDAASEETEPLIAQGRDGIWRIWFGDEQANMQGDLGSWLSVEFVKDEDRQVVAYLPSTDHDVEVTTPDGDPVVGAEIRYAEPHEADGRFAWISAPSGSEITWVDTDGAREPMPEP
ncbi:hypothetical protein FNH13_14780 [Ornithinimicrobium ciconiae]|uniref:Uncharacterized protein n=1 Tax=Ornithinimicrobium ciconiae TaxID=2594265 RepID=A0A516GD41_9MICO|nr:hypothetical protein [Ornithinimicrobium ciconiae]QDO89438.1 hypothetical protein FNH13_14780 [Ornithinimicrobium ciconiae]